jgi:hypothetical protein
MSQVSIIARLLATLAALIVSACVNQGPPKTAGKSQTIVIDYTRDELSSWSDMPIGTYRVPESQLLVSGHQKGNGIGMLFGLPGIAIENAADSSGGKAAVQSSEGALHVTLFPEAQQDLATLLQTPAFSGKFTLTANSADAVLSISGNIVLQFLNETEVRPYVILKAKLRNPKDTTSTWSTRYAASIGPARPLTGENGWTTNSGALLKLAVSTALQRSLTVMLTDVSTPFPRDDSRKITVEGNFAFLKKRLQVTGFLLAEDPDWIAFSAGVPDTSLLAGVNIMDKSVTTFRPTTKDDPRIKAAAPKD